MAGLAAALTARRAGKQVLLIEKGTMLGALAMTTPGDTSMANKAEVFKLMQGAGARVDR